VTAPTIADRLERLGYGRPGNDLDQVLHQALAEFEQVRASERLLRRSALAVINMPPPFDRSPRTAADLIFHWADRAHDLCSFALQRLCVVDRCGGRWRVEEQGEKSCPHCGGPAREISL
jgi:hypothetical protein